MPAAAFSDVWYSYLESMEERFHFGIAGVANDDALYIAESIARELGLTEGRFAASLGGFLLPISESAMASGD